MNKTTMTDAILAAKAARDDAYIRPFLHVSNLLVLPILLSAPLRLARP